MKRKERHLTVTGWVVVGLLDTLAGVISGGAYGLVAAAQYISLARLLGNRRGVDSHCWCNHYCVPPDARTADAGAFWRKEEE